MYLITKFFLISKWPHLELHTYDISYVVIHIWDEIHTLL